MSGPTLEIKPEIVAVLEIESGPCLTLELSDTEVQIVEVEAVKAVLEIEQTSVQLLAVAEQGPMGPPGPPGPPGSGGLPPNFVLDGGNF